MRGDGNGMRQNDNRRISLLKQSGILTIAVGMFLFMFAFGNMNSTMAADQPDSIYEYDPSPVIETVVTESVYETLQQAGMSILLEDNAAQMRQFRGAWIATVSNLDWPSNRYT